jgi:hypothetical protein
MSDAWSVLPTDQTAHLNRATTYPYARPTGSYVLANGQALSLVETGEDPLALEAMRVQWPAGVSRAPHEPDGRAEPDGPGERDGQGEVLTLAELAKRRDIDRAQLAANRTPVICYGANTAMEALTRKFVQTPEDVLIPAIEASLKDFDVVFSAHLSSYGAMPATLQRSAGTTVQVFVLALTDGQLEVMHATETPYRFVELTEIELAFGGPPPGPGPGPAPGGPALGESAPAARKLSVRSAAHTYISRNGATLVEGSEVALSAIPAEGRRHPGYSQLEMLTWLRDELAPGQAVEEFVLEHIDDPAVKEGRSEWLRGRARPFTRAPGDLAAHGDPGPHGDSGPHEDPAASG